MNAEERSTASPDEEFVPHLEPGLPRSFIEEVERIATTPCPPGFYPIVDDDPVPVSADAATRERRRYRHAQARRIYERGTSALFPHELEALHAALGSTLDTVEALESERSVLAAKIEAVEAVLVEDWTFAHWRQLHEAVRAALAATEETK